METALSGLSIIGTFEKQLGSRTVVVSEQAKIGKFSSNFKVGTT